MRNDENDFKNNYEKLTNYELIPIFQLQHQKREKMYQKQMLFKPTNTFLRLKKKKGK